MHYYSQDVPSSSDDVTNANTYVTYLKTTNSIYSSRASDISTKIKAYDANVSDRLFESLIYKTENNNSSGSKNILIIAVALIICVAIIVVGFIIFAMIALYYMKLFGKQPMDDKITNHKKSLKDREDKILYLAEEKKAEREALLAQKLTDMSQLAKEL